MSALNLLPIALLCRNAAQRAVHQNDMKRKHKARRFLTHLVYSCPPLQSRSHWQVRGQQHISPEICQPAAIRRVNTTTMRIPEMFALFLPTSAARPCLSSPSPAPLAGQCLAFGWHHTELPLLALRSRPCLHLGWLPIATYCNPHIHDPD